MSDVSQISVVLTPEMAAAVDQAVDSGEFGTPSEVVREALRDWKLRRSAVQDERRHLQSLWAEGLASGPGRYDDIAAIKAEARRRLTDSPKVSG